MTLGLGVLLFGVLLIYAGWTGKSFTHLIRGDNQTQATRTDLLGDTGGASSPAPPPPAASTPTAPAPSSRPPVQGSHGGSGNQ